jgi:hypothetical protein
MTLKVTIIWSKALLMGNRGDSDRHVLICVVGTVGKMKRRIDL